jgi:hypothetical protein
MIRRQIQPDSNIGTKGRNGLQLKGTDFHRENFKFLLAQNRIGERHPNVTTGNGTTTRAIQHGLNQLSGSRLAIRAGNGDHRSFTISERQLKLSHQDSALPAKILDEWNHWINPRTQDSQFIIRLSDVGGGTGDYRDSKVLQCLYFLGIRFPAVENGDAGAALVQKSGSGFSAGP